MKYTIDNTLKTISLEESVTIKQLNLLLVDLETMLGKDLEIYTLVPKQIVKEVIIPADRQFYTQPIPCVPTLPRQPFYPHCPITCNNTGTPYILSPSSTSTNA